MSQVKDTASAKQQDAPKDTPVGKQVSIKDAIGLAAKLAGEGKLGQAEKICNDIIASNDKFHPAYNLLGQLAFRVHKLEIAAKMFHKAVLIDGTIAPYHRDLAEVVHLGGRPKDALVIIERALKINPNMPKCHYIAGMALGALGARDKSVEAYKKAIELNPNYGLAYNNLGSSLEILGDIDGAKAAYNRAVEINENHPEAQNNLAAILIAEGDVDGATKHFEAAIKARPMFVDPHYNLSTLKNYSEEDPHIGQLEAIGRDTSKLPMDARIRLCFALGKAYEDAGKYEAAFDLYSSGNTAKRATFNYNEDHAIKTTEAIKSVFDKAYFTGLKKKKSDDPTPIFVVGMPRSGSTLVEQILCSHSEVHGAGELITLSQCISKKVKNFPADLADLSDDELKSIGEDYLTEIKKLNPEAKYIVDKMPANFHYAGLIAKILPGAHILNTARNPMDSCLSNYTRLFNQTMNFAYDLEDLGRYYNRYQDIMAHWRKVLPKKTLLDVHYEDVVDNLEREARAMTDFIGLKWEKECLEFHKNKRRVHTASVAQVRKPIYKSSVERWRHFGDALNPLKALVAPDLK